MKVRRLLVAAVALVLLSGSAFAQGGTSLGWGQTARPTQSGTNPQGGLKIAIVGGVNPADSSAVPFQFDAGGPLKMMDTDRDRDFPTFINLFNAVVLNPSTAYQPNQPRYIGQFTRASLLLTWGAAAAADSDSTFLLVRIYGKTSLNSGNYYLWTPMGSSIVAGDTCQCNALPADSAGAATKCITPAPSFVVVRGVTNYSLLTKVLASATGGGTATTRSTLRKIPSYAWRYAGAGGVMLDLSDNAGNPCPFPFIWVEAWNLNFTRGLTGLTCDVWPRVN